VTPTAAALFEKLIALFKGIASRRESDTEVCIRLMKGVVTVGTDLLVELRAEQQSKETVTR